MTPDPLGFDFLRACPVDYLATEVVRLRAEVARLRAVGEDDIATWAEYVTGKKWAPVDAVTSPEG